MKYLRKTIFHRMSERDGLLGLLAMAGESRRQGYQHVWWSLMRNNRIKSRKGGANNDQKRHIPQGH